VKAGLIARPARSASVQRQQARQVGGGGLGLCRGAAAPHQRCGRATNSLDVVGSRLGRVPRRVWHYKVPRWTATGLR